MPGRDPEGEIPKKSRIPNDPENQKNPGFRDPGKSRRDPVPRRSLLKTPLLCVLSTQFSQTLLKVYLFFHQLYRLFAVSLLLEKSK